MSVKFLSIIPALVLNFKIIFFIYYFVCYPLNLPIGKRHCIRFLKKKKLLRDESFHNKSNLKRLFIWFFVFMDNWTCWYVNAISNPRNIFSAVFQRLRNEEKSVGGTNIFYRFLFCDKSEHLLVVEKMF